MESWLNKKVSVYEKHAKNIGEVRTIRQVLFSDFGKDLETIIKLRKLNRESEDYEKDKLKLKSKLQCYTPAALLASKAKGELTEIERTGLMQLDFDRKDVCDYDLEELKQAVFSLEFIAFCGLSCSGDGFYALALIAEPERLSEYAEHCFEVLKTYGIKADESKGRNVKDLRYLSYDENFLWRDNPVELRIKHFKRKQTNKPAVKAYSSYNQTSGPDGLPNSKLKAALIANSKLKAVMEAQPGNRWATIQNAAFVIGGLCNREFLPLLIDAINKNSAFSGLEAKYIKCAEYCFNEGFNQPLLI